MSKYEPVPPQSVDGFTLRRRGTQQSTPDKRADKSVTLQTHLLTDTLHSEQERISAVPSPDISITPVSDAPVSGGLSRVEIDESLNAVDERPTEKSPKKRRFRRVRVRKKWIFLTAVVLILAITGYFVAKTLLAGGRVFNGNVFDLLGEGAKLQQDANGRTNILVFGTSEDDPSHDGANLTDSIMMLSIDQKNKTAAMVSMPRDLWVDYGEACPSGYSGKINVVYMCGEENGGEAAGAKKLMAKVGEVFGYDIQYYAHVNYSVVRDTVNAVGGITVTIDSSDPRGIMDRNMDWTCNYSCYLVKWPNGTATLNGDQALALARARGEGTGYGLSGGNFDREKYQQRIMVAIRDKALSAGTLANPIAVSGLIDALGNNLRTNFSAAEVKTLTTLAKDIKSTDIKSISLVDKDHPVVTTGMYSGQSIVRPIAGIDDFSGIQDYIKQKLAGGVIADENATIEVLNASSLSGVAKKEQTKLESAGLVNVSIGDTSYSSSPAVVWYDLSGGAKPKTQEKLTQTIGAAAAGSTLPTGVQSDANFVILVGNGFN